MSDILKYFNLKRILNRIGKYRFSRLNLIKTLLFNFWAFDFKTAIKFPVYIYSHTKIYQIGKVTITGKITRGMIRIGIFPAKAFGPTRIIGYGTYIFHGKTSIRGGCILENHGTIEFGEDFGMGEACTILCRNNIKFGDKISVGFRNTFMDSSFHYILDTKNRIVFRDTDPIEIKSGSWITSDCKVMQGARLPENSILIANSVLKSDLSAEPSNQMYGGNPAKPIGRNKRRLFNRIEEQRIYRFFTEHPSKMFLKVNFEDEDTYCLDNAFNNYR